MLDHGHFFLPGPTEVRPEVLEAMTRPLIAHRGDEMQAILGRIHRQLQALFGTARPVYIVGSSGTGAMEMAIRSGSRQRVLALVSGGFGERFALIAEQCGREVVRLAVPFGESVDSEQVRTALDGDGSFDTVTAVHSESSTGALTDIERLASVTRARADTMLLVDGVTSVGAMPIQMDAWGADLYLTASQKALAMPPGLAFLAASERLLERARTIPRRGMYLDIVRHEEFWRKSQTPVTPPTSLVFAADVQLAEIEREGLEPRFARHAAMAHVCRRWAQRAEGGGLGVRLLTQHGARSPTVSCLTCGRPGSVLGGMRAQGYTIGGGYGELAQSSVRIGHMGDHTVTGLEAMLDVLDGVLRTHR